MLETQVNQVQYPAYLEGRSKPFRLNKRGELVVSDWLQQAVLDGFGYVVQQATPDTLVTGSTSYVATDPALYLGVPEGVTAYPFWLNIAFEDTAGTDNYVTIGCDTAVLYSSGGGTAGSLINNLRSDDLHASACTHYNGQTAIVITDPGAGERILWTWCNPFADVATDPPRVIVWEPTIIPKLVGPASFFVYIYGSTKPAFNYNLQWVEVPTPSA